jgi:hypothetical protein
MLRLGLELDLRSFEDPPSTWTINAVAERRTDPTVEDAGSEQGNWYVTAYRAGACHSALALAEHDVGGSAYSMTNGRDATEARIPA